MENGGARDGAGRPKGVPNKATADGRAAIAAFVDGNVERLNGLLDSIEKDNGAKAAFDSIMSVCEYHIPKLARKEHVGDPDKPLKTELTLSWKSDK